VENINTSQTIDTHMSNNEKKEDEIVFKGRTEAIYKVIVIGDPAVGKRELLAKFAVNQFEEKYLPTVGVSILKEPIELNDFNATVNLMFWDIAGQPQFYMLHRPYFNGADGMLLVFDITRSSTFSNINNWYSAAVKYGLSGIPRILIGNKAHIKGERRIILPMAEYLAEKLNAHYYETSTLSGENIKEAFEKIAEEVYRAKLNKPKKNKKLIIKPYQGELIEIPEEIPSQGGVKRYSFYEKEDSFLKYIFKKFGGIYYPYIPRSIFEKEKKKKKKKKKYQQKEKAKLEKEKKKKEKKKYQRDLFEVLKGKKQQEPDGSFKVPTEIKQLRKTFSKIEKGKGKSYVPLSPQLGISGTSYRIELGLLNDKWAFRLLKGKDIIDISVFKDKDLSTYGIPNQNLIVRWVLRTLAIPNIKPRQIMKPVRILTNQVIKNIIEKDLRKSSNRENDDDDRGYFPYPYIFNPPKPPDDFAMAPQVQVRKPPKKKYPEEEIYCQFCGRALPKEEEFTHSCKKKPINK